MPSLRRPRAIRPGARIAIAAPAGPVDPEALASGRTALERLGFETVARDDVLDRDGYLAGSDERRSSELMDFVRDPEVDAPPVMRRSATSSRPEAGSRIRPLLISQFICASAKEIKDRHPHRDPVCHLVENNAVRSIGDL